MAAPTRDQKTEIDISDLSDEDKAVIKQLHSKNYESLGKDIIAKHLQDVAKQLVKLLKPDYLAPLLEDERFKKIYNKWESNRNPSYEEIIEFYEKLTVALKNQMGKHKEESTNQIFDYAHRSVEMMLSLEKSNMPTYLQAVKDLITLHETKHVLKTAKKSRLRKIIEWIRKKLRTKVTAPTISILQPSTDLRSITKKIATVFSDAFSKSYTQEAENTLKLLEATIQARKKSETMPLHVSAPKIDKPKTDSIAGTVITGGAKITKDIATGTARYLGISGLVDFISTEPDPQALRKSLREHIDECFDYEAKKCAFEGLLNFVQQFYSLYETTQRMHQNHPDFTIDFHNIGFAHLNTPKFKEFAMQLSTALGFEMAPEEKPFQIIQKLCYATEAQQKVAFERFLKGDEAKGVGLTHAVTYFEREIKRMNAQPLDQKSKSTHYNYLVTHFRDMLVQLQYDSKNKGAITAALKATGLEEIVYNPDATGILTQISSELKQRLINTLPKATTTFLGSAIQKKNAAVERTQAYQQAITDEFSKWLNTRYPPPQEFSPAEYDTYLSRVQKYI